MTGKNISKNEGNSAHNFSNKTTIIQKIITSRGKTCIGLNQQLNKLERI